MAKYKHVCCVTDEVSNELAKLDKAGFEVVSILSLGDKNRNDIQIIVKK